MIESIARYTKYFTRIVIEGKARYLARDLRAITGSHGWDKFPDRAARKASLDAAIGWLKRSQEIGTDGGMASFHLVDGWSGSYPETTGYIIPTLLYYARIHKDSSAEECALRAAGFLLDIELPGGGWQGGRIGEDKPAVVFNTAQVIRGLLSTYQHTGDGRFLESIVRGCDWLCSVQHPEGFWRKHALMEKPRVYDAFVDVPLLRAAKETGREEYREAALRNLGWITGQKMQANGWFNDCDNTVKHNLRPILHTIAYTLDGLVDAASHTGERHLLEAGMMGASVLKNRFLKDGILKGRYDARWKGTESFICTGGAQMAITWMKIHKETGQADFLDAARRMAALLIRIQTRPGDSLDTLGAIPGSFPLWGRYEPFAFPNWATKFFCDALMMLDEMES